MLEARGFRVAYVSYYARMAPLEGPDAMAHYLRQYTPEYLTIIPAEQQAAFIAAVEDRVRPTLYRDGGWWMDFMRLRVQAVRPG